MGPECSLDFHLHPNRKRKEMISQNTILLSKLPPAPSHSKLPPAPSHYPSYLAKIVIAALGNRGPGKPDFKCIQS
jgi:hypothetical protein